MFSVEIFDEHCLICAAGNSYIFRLFSLRRTVLTMLPTPFKDIFEIENSSGLGLTFCFTPHFPLLLILIYYHPL